MAWKGRSQILQGFSDLLTILSNSKVGQADPALENVVNQIITRSGRNHDAVQLAIKNLLTQVGDLGDLVVIINNIFKTIDFITGSDQTLDLPASLQLIAGAGITFDDTVPNQKIVMATGSGGYWTPLTDGDLDETDLIFASGEAIAVFVPV